MQDSSLAYVDQNVEFHMVSAISKIVTTVINLYVAHDNASSSNAVRGN